MVLIAAIRNGHELDGGSRVLCQQHIYSRVPVMRPGVFGIVIIGGIDPHHESVLVIVVDLAVFLCNDGAGPIMPADPRDVVLVVCKFVAFVVVVADIDRVFLEDLVVAQIFPVNTRDSLSRAFVVFFPGMAVSQTAFVVGDNVFVPARGHEPPVVALSGAVASQITVKHGIVVVIIIVIVIVVVPICHRALVPVVQLEFRQRRGPGSIEDGSL
mmetsp:Transcript_11251/g.26143  ORF Transcript_11251/g.26143 Transcript_11251/m.26143 type:complete len:213 (+) Transcript_11251:964-1602(+)